MIIFYIISALLLISVFNAVCFYLLVDGKVNFKEAFVLSSVAAALNKFFFSGSGYLISSYCSKHKKMDFYQALAAFAVFEACVAFLYICLAVYFGARMVYRFPWVVMGVLFLFIILGWRKRKGILNHFRKIISCFSRMKYRVICIIPFVIILAGLNVVYYFTLFRMFGFNLDSLAVSRIFFVSFSVGYLSPFPTGLGSKDASLVLLLAEQGVRAKTAVSCALVDRGIVTLFFLMLGIFSGSGLILPQLKARFSRHRSA